MFAARSSSSSRKRNQEQAQQLSTASWLWLPVLAASLLFCGVCFISPLFTLPHLASAHPPPPINTQLKIIFSTWWQLISRPRTHNAREGWHRELCPNIEAARRQTQGGRHMWPDQEKRGRGSLPGYTIIVAAQHAPYISGFPSFFKLFFFELARSWAVYEYSCY